MAPLESILVWISLCGYGIISGLYIYAFVFRKENILQKIIYPIAAVFLIHTASIIARYVAVGNLPWAGDYESATAGSWFVVLFTIIFMWKHRSLSAIGVGTIPFSLLLFGFGVMRSPQLIPMSVSLKSFWLGIHVLFAWLAFGAFAIAFGLGIIYLLKEKNPRKEFYAKFPDLPMLDELMFKYVVFGFITDAVMIPSGAIWAKDLWGNYWSWDPVETWSLVTWLIYGFAIHLRLTMGWRGRRLAWIVIWALAGMVITFFGINFFVSSSLHLFRAMQGQ
ncbi:cytochrome c biogenesis protein CcsA [Geotalea toluenoxydans]|uniref:cytochrome c biogenesis protein CcsA n=1 Tax=Geotalea toluenoxydans TaxID=421624 RepID=UPI0006D1A5F5|nr:cytochrome c biogenesis protein CcsA [Geotalea toluenoxydans]